MLEFVWRWFVHYVPIIRKRCVRCGLFTCAVLDWQIAFFSSINLLSITHFVVLTYCVDGATVVVGAMCVVWYILGRMALTCRHKECSSMCIVRTQRISASVKMPTPDREINKMQSFGTDLVTFSLKNKLNVWPQTVQPYRKQAIPYLSCSRSTREQNTKKHQFFCGHCGYCPRVKSNIFQVKSTQKQRQWLRTSHSLLQCRLKRQIEPVTDNYHSPNWLTTYNSVAHIYRILSSVAHKFVSHFLSKHRLKAPIIKSTNFALLSFFSLPFFRSEFKSTFEFKKKTSCFVRFLCSSVNLWWICIAFSFQFDGKENQQLDNWELIHLFNRPNVKIK